MVYLYTSLGKYDLAKEALDIVKSKFPGDENILSAEWYLKTFFNSSSQFVYNNGQQNTTSTKNQALLNVQLYENYPSPFNLTTTISYTLPEDGKVLIKVYDILGREVATLLDGFSSAGKHSIIWNGNNISSGIYFYTITFKNRTLYKKMLLMK